MAVVKGRHMGVVCGAGSCEGLREGGGWNSRYRGSWGLRMRLRYLYPMH